MLHEIILALLGHPGAIVQEESTSSAKTTSRHGAPSARSASASACTFRVPESITFLTSTEREAINRVVGMGCTYRHLRKFVRPSALPLMEGPISAFGAQDSGSLYVRALKLGVCEVLDEYAVRVAEVERDVMEDPTLTLARVYAGVREVRYMNRRWVRAMTCLTSPALVTALSDNQRTSHEIPPPPRHEEQAGCESSIICKI